MSSQAVNRAFDRIAVLTRIINEERRRAVGSPTDERYVKLGIVERGAKKADASKSVNDMFNDLQDLLNHLAILDMTASFELHVRSRIKTAIGDARKAATSSKALSEKSWAKNLIRDDVVGLADIGSVLGIMENDLTNYNLIRQSRNKFSHGTDLSVPPPVTAEDVYRLLNSIIAKI